MDSQESFEIMSVTGDSGDDQEAGVKYYSASIQVSQDKSRMPLTLP